jgi:hypothetical protein
MKFLSKQSSGIFRKLVTQMGNDDHLKLDNSNGTFMPIIIERLHELPEPLNGHKVTVYSLSHYYEQNGDLIPDPDMTFAVTDEVIIPLTYQDTYRYDEAVQISPNPEQWLVRQKMYDSLVSFSNMWLRNIKEQQNL